MAEAFRTIIAYHDIISARYNPREFVGRSWLIEEVTHFRDDKDRRSLIIVGEPGSGKSTFLAYLAELWNCPRHFIRLDNTSGVTGVDPRAFLVSLGSQLYQKYGPDIFERGVSSRTQVTVGWTKDQAEIVGRLVDELYTLPFLQLQRDDVQVKVGVATGHSRVLGERVKRLVDVTLTLDELALLHATLINPLQKVQELYPNEKVIILVDALDESMHHAGTNILDVLPQPADTEFPANLRIVMTSRDGRHLSKFRSTDLLYLDDKKKGHWQANQQDIQEYIKKRLSEAPFIGMIAAWKREETDDYVVQVMEHSQNNFLYLYHFFNELAARVGINHADLQSFGIPKGLSEIYRSFAVEKIRRNVDSTIRITTAEEVPVSLLAQLKTAPNVSGVEIVDRDILLTTVDSDQVTPALFSLLPSAGVQIIKFQTQKAEQFGVWEEKYLPILGVMAVAYEPLYREQIAGFAGVEVVYVDSVLAQLKQFLDKVIDERATAYQFYHTSFSEYLLSSQQNRDYPLDGPKYHTQIAAYYLGTHSEWSEVDWLAVRDNYPLDHLPAHLEASGHGEDLIALMKDLRYITAKTSIRNTYATEADLARAKIQTQTGPTLDLLVENFANMSHILDRCETVREIAPILHGRLVHLEELSSLCQAFWPDIPRPFLTPWHFLPDLPHPLLIRTLQGHRGAVNACAISPTGTFMVSASRDATLKVWDVDTGIVRRTLQGHTGPVLGCAVSSSEDYIISASSDHTLKIWNAHTGDQYRTLQGHTGFVNSCAVSPGEDYVVSASSDHTLKVWDLQTGAERLTLRGHTNRVNCCAVSQTGEYIVSASDDFTLKVWDALTGAEQLTLRGHTEPVNGCAIHPTGDIIISASNDRTLKIWDAYTGIEYLTLQGHADTVIDCQVSPNGDYIVSVSNDTTLKVWDIRTWAQRLTLQGHTSWLTGCAVHPVGDIIVSASLDATLKIWNISKETIALAWQRHPERVQNCAVSPTGDFVVSAQNDYLSDKYTLKIWNPHTGEDYLTLHGHDLIVSSCSVSPGGNYIVSASLDTTLKVWDVSSGAEKFTLRGHADGVNGCAVSPYGEYIVSASDDGTLKIWDARTGKNNSTLRGHTQRVNSCAVSPKGDYIVSASDDGTLKIWDAHTGTEKFTLRGHTQRVNSCAVSPKGDYIVSASNDRTLKVWDTQTWQERFTLQGHQEGVSGCAVSLSGDHIVSVSADQMLKVWNGLTGICLTSLIVDRSLLACAFHPDSEHIIACGEQGLYFLRLVW